jgi:hypothetical protein
LNGLILELGGPDHAAAQRPVEPPGASPSPWVLLLGLYVLTLAAQFTSLAFGRIQPEHDFATMLLPSLLFLSVLTLPALWIGLPQVPHPQTSDQARCSRRRLFHQALVIHVQRVFRKPL